MRDRKRLPKKLIRECARGATQAYPSAADGSTVTGATQAGARRPVRGRGVGLRSPNELQQIFELRQSPFAI
jgi:hypothetical protein